MTVQEELEKISRRNGGILRPEDVVRAAEPENSVLHSRFDWNDTTAAHKWRLEQARHIIRVFVEVLDPGNPDQESRVFVALTQDREGGGGYRTLTDVLSDKMLREALLQDAHEDMVRFTQKYSALKELSEVFSAMKKASKKNGASLAAK